MVIPSPFGIACPASSGLMPERSLGSANYRYLFNGMESDNEVSGNGNSYTTEFRQYDPRLGRWKSLDPLMGQFPWMSPYVAFDNNPVYFIDPFGLEGTEPTDADKEKGTWTSDSGTNYTYDKELEEWYRDEVVVNTGTKDDLNISPSTASQEINSVENYRRKNAIYNLTYTIPKTEDKVMKELIEGSEFSNSIKDYLDGEGKLISVASLDIAVATNLPSNITDIMEAQKKGKIIAKNGNLWKNTWTTGNQYVSKETVEATKKAFSGQVKTIQVVKGVGVVLTLAGGGISILQYINGDISGGKLSADLVMTAVSFVPGVGWIVSGVYFMVDATIGWDTIIEGLGEGAGKSGDFMLNAFPAGF